MNLFDIPIHFLQIQALQQSHNLCGDPVLIDEFVPTSYHRSSGKERGGTAI